MLTRHRAQPGEQPSKVLWPGTAARGPLVGKAGVEGDSGFGGVGVVGVVGVVVEGVVVGVVREEVGAPGLKIPGGWEGGWCKTAGEMREALTQIA